MKLLQSSNLTEAFLGEEIFRFPQSLCSYACREVFEERCNQKEVEGSGQKDAIPGFPTNHAATLHEGSSANVVSGRAEAH